MSGLEVIGGISAIVSILEASVHVYNSARKDLDLPQAFVTVGRRLPILLDTLLTCKRQLEPNPGTIPNDVGEALEQILNSCDEKAVNLRNIFEKVIASDKDSWRDRYVKVLKRLGQGNKVEELMISITEDVQLLVNHYAVRTASPRHLTQLEETIKELKSVKPSISETQIVAMSFDNEGGVQTNYVNSGKGQQVNNLAAVGTQYLGPGITLVTVKPLTNYEFSGPTGFCLNQAPYIDPTLFVGRASELDQMAQKLKPRDKYQGHRRLNLGGIGGIGKTQLAVSYAHRYRDHYQSAFWINATTEDTVKDSFRLIAERLFGGSEDENLNDERSVTLAHRWLCDKENTRWLLIFDNYDEPSQFDLTQYYPVASHGAIIVTTRRPDLVAGQAILLKPLPIDNTKECLEILEKRSQREDTKNDPYAHKLAVRLGGLPLALATVGAYLSTSPLSYQRYLEEYEKHWDVDPDWSHPLPENQDRTLYTTWNISYERLKAERPDAASLLQLLAYFDNQNIWHRLLQAGIVDDSPEWLHRVVRDDARFASGMRTLTNYCFVEVQQSVQSVQSWSMHSCVHDWTLVQLNTPLSARNYQYAYDCVNVLINQIHWESLSHSVNAPLVPHAMRLTDEKLQDVRQVSSEIRGENPLLVAEFLRCQDQFAPAEIMFKWVLARLEAMPRLDRALIAKTVNHLGLLYWNQDKYDKAEEMYSRGLSESEKVLGPKHIDTLNIVNNLGLLYQDQGRPKEAEEMLRRALNIAEETLGPHHLSTLDIIYNLAALYQGQEKLEEVESMYKRVISGWENKLGLDYTSALDAILNLGVLYMEQKRFEESERMYKRALAGREKIRGPQHVDTLRVVHNFAILYHNQGRLEEAERWYQQALAGYQKILEPGHPQILKVSRNLEKLRTAPPTRRGHDWDTNEGLNGNRTCRKRDRFKNLLLLRGRTSRSS